MTRVGTSTRLKELMQNRDLRQVDILNLVRPICDRFNVKMNKSDISQYVSGKVEPSQEKLVVLGMALGVTEAWLMGFDVSPERKDSDKPLQNTLSSQIKSIYGSDAYEMLLMFSKLNNVGKEKALENLSDLSEIPRYSDSHQEGLKNA